MKLTRYTKFTGDLSTSFDLEDLMEALSDFFLDSGFDDPWSQFQNASDSIEDLREAIRQALDSGDLLDEDAQEKYEELPEEGKQELVDKIIQRMKDEAFLNAESPEDAEGQAQQGDGNSENTRFEVTDKAMDFLGFKALRDLLGPLGKSRSAATTRSTRPPASRPTAPPSDTNSATPSTSTSPPRSSQRLRARGPARCRSTSSTPTSRSSVRLPDPPAPPS